jgi:uncharacterized protein YbaR (Trm112 family)
LVDAMSETEKSSGGVHPLLLGILVCPVCRTSVREVNNALVCTNVACRRRYPVREGIPIMLIDEAEVVPEGEFSA